MVREQAPLVPVAFQFPWWERFQWPERFLSILVVAHLFQIYEANQKCEVHPHCQMARCVAHGVAEAPDD